MPAHIYIRVGRYEDASKANYAAIRADEDYITQCRAQGIYPAAYYPHNIHFLTATLAMEGRSAELMDASRKVGGQHDHAAMNQPGFGFPHLLHALPKLSLVRFGRWDDILKLEQPADSAFDQGMWHFARGMAFMSTKRLTEAQAELNRLRIAAQQPELANLKIFDLNSLASIAQIAVEVLDGEITAKRGNTAAGVKHLRKAVELEDNLLYSEPPDWPIPPRHNLGAVLLTAGRAAEAEQVYREDLQRHRNNGWALYGLAKSLEAQGKDAADVWVRFNKTWRRADVQLTASRF
jgi:tetratricopeptide (TPR) repeat protein